MNTWLSQKVSLPASHQPLTVYSSMRQVIYPSIHPYLPPFLPFIFGLFASSFVQSFTIRFIFKWSVRKLVSLLIFSFCLILHWSFHPSSCVAIHLPHFLSVNNTVRPLVGISSYEWVIKADKRMQTNGCCHMWMSQSTRGQALQMVVRHYLFRVDCQVWNWEALSAGVWIWNIS